MKVRLKKKTVKFTITATKIKFVFWSIGFFILVVIMLTAKQKPVNSRKFGYYDSSKVTPVRYLELFNEGSISKLQPAANYYFKQKYPISKFKYGSDFGILIYSMSNVNDVRFLDQVTEVVDSNCANFNFNYSNKLIYTNKFIPVDDKFYYFLINSDTFLNIKNIKLNFDGTFYRRNIINDSVISYNIKLKNFYVGYTNDHVPDLLIRHKSNMGEVNFVILKRQSSFYIVILYPLNPNVVVANDQLLTILKT